MTNRQEMKVLELFCGLGGWSRPWVEAGHDVTGIDFVDFSKHYPGRFIKADLLDWEPDQHYDIVLASPPCTEFSIAKKWGWGTQNEMKGLDLIYRTFHLIDKIKPKYYLVENVKDLSNFLPPPSDIVRYGSRNKSGKAAYLWTNFGRLPMLNFHFRFRFANTKKPGANDEKNKGEKHYGGARKANSRKPMLKSTCKTKAERALIPLPLAQKVYEVLQK